LLGFGPFECLPLVSPCPPFPSWTARRLLLVRCTAPFPSTLVQVNFFHSSLRNPLCFVRRLDLTPDCAPLLASLSFAFSPFSFLSRLQFSHQTAAGFPLNTWRLSPFSPAGRKAKGSSISTTGSPSCPLHGNVRLPRDLIAFWPLRTRRLLLSHLL